MKKEELTPEEIQKHIKSSFDSVDIITKTITETKDDKKSKTVKRNYQHLESMLSKEWFSTALTTVQRKSIDDSITSGKAY